MECVVRGCGGFVFRDNCAYMCSLPSKELRMRAKPANFPNTRLFTVEEIRLCSVRTSGAKSKPADGDPGKTRRGCVRLFCDCLPQRTRAVDGKMHVHMMNQIPVCIGLECFPGQDAFPGSDSRKIWDASLGQCKQICLEEGFGGFAMYDDCAVFRTASPEVLQRGLEPAGNATFYVLAVEPLICRDDVPSGQGVTCAIDVSKLWDPGNLHTDSSNKADDVNDGATH